MVSVFNARIQITTSGRERKYRKGFLNIPVHKMEEIGWKRGEVVVVVMRKSDKITPEILSNKIKDYKKMVLMEEQLIKMKKNMFEEENETNKILDSQSLVEQTKK